MGRIRDDLVVFNERVKLVANLFHTTALGLIGFAVLQPMVRDGMALEWQALWWGLGGLAFHLAAHYILGTLRKEHADDPV
ncbi:hypothetical protein [Oceaniglobus roseus]|uniref:hypothetical protein n=1 Tax=Oceaniglobus roseus TaxID=1737570 RepID=UPI000C7F5A4C|nr:hypothetical protein [Kandeliimicrobium roseum]